VPELASQAVIVTNGDAEGAAREATALARAFWPHRRRIQADLVPIDTAIAEAKRMKGPVIFTDAADATSSGASGDSAKILGALVEADYPGTVLAPLVDRPAAEAAHQAGTGATIDVALGGSLDKRFKPVRLTAEVRMLSDGKAALETSGHALDAGPSALLVAGNLTILVMSRAVSLFDRAMFFAHDCDPKHFDLIVVKSPYCEYQMFDEWSERNFNVDAPGSTSADVAALGHINCRRPMFPIDDDFEFDPVAETYRRER
ncbi:MAG TPA: MlrC C-terminal domain-containing protein, partial [Afifellaceae bacterium]|nr:MlrC C-terminal domain-containing protein [Afifellaceae bacterium]